MGDMIQTEGVTEAQKNNRINVLAQVGLLSAVIVLMAFTPLGYLRFSVIEATLLMIPVALGAIRLGPRVGAWLGAVFGLTSFAQCFGISWFGTQLASISLLATFVTAMVPRVLMGILVALIYRALVRSKSRETFAMGAAFFASALLNTILFVGLFYLLFGSSDFVRDMQAGRSLMVFLAWFIGINGIVELIAATVGGSIIGTALQRAGVL